MGRLNALAMIVRSSVLGLYTYHISPDSQCMTFSTN